VLERADFDSTLRQHPGIALALTRVMAERVESANRNAGIDFVSLSRIKIDPRVLRCCRRRWSMRTARSPSRSSTTASPSR
jgi:CRP-like cAMP-binding protein